MKQFASSDIRNVSLVGQKGAGKTTLGEAMLFTSKAITRLGRVDAGNTTLDFEPEEHKRLGSVQATLAWLEWNKKKINILDTPGSRDFLGDTQNCLAVTEGACFVLNATGDVDPYTAKLFAAAGGAARAVVVNQIGRERADFGRVLVDCKENLTPGAVAITLPIGREESFRGVVDLMSFKAHLYEPGSAKAPAVEDVPADMLEEAQAARETLVEEIAGSDEALMETYLDAGELTAEEARIGLQRAILAGTLTPVFATDAAHNIGVADVLNFVAAAVPDPCHGRVLNGAKDGVPTEIPPDPAAPFLGVVFKTIMDQHSGKISVFRVTQGQCSRDTNLTNLNQNEAERLGGLLTLVGKKVDHVDTASLGDIVGVAKLKITRTGETLAVDADRPHVVLPDVPHTQIAYRLLPRRKGDEDKIGQALARLCEEDPTLVSGHDELTSDLTLAGLGVTHIDASLEKMSRKYNIEVDKQPPLVPYRETLHRAVRGVEGKHKKQSGGRGQFGVAYIHMRPLERGEGYKFVDNIFGGSIPRQYIPAVDKGIQEAAARGVVAGYPVVDIEVDLHDGKYHDVDSSEMAFKIAGSKAFREAMKTGGTQILEPIMNVEIEVPDASMGDVMGDVSSRRGRVLGMDSRGNVSTVKAQIPMAEMLTYAPDLSSMTAGRGVFTMAFDHYEPLPANLTDKVAAESPHKPRAADDE